MTDLSRCENASTGITTVITPRCWNNIALMTVIVDYGSERDVFELCGPCSDAIKRDARKYGYEVTRKLYKGN